MKCTEAKGGRYGLLTPWDVSCLLPADFVDCKDVAHTGRNRDRSCGWNLCLTAIAPLPSAGEILV